MTTCPVCDSKKIRQVILSQDYRNNSTEIYKHIECDGCGALRLPIKPTAKYYDYSYGDKYYKKTSVNKFKVYFENKYGDFINFQKLRLILKVFGNKKKIKILDIGSGNLSFLASVYDPVFEKHAIDIYKSEVNQPKINIINADFLTHDFKDKKFDVITSWHVIEHVSSPKKFLTKTHQLLNDRGIAIISTPNLDSLGFRWFKKDWYHLDAPRHLVLFGDSLLKELSEKTNFTKSTSINMFYEFPFDLWHSAKRSNFLIKLLIFLFYPVLKIFDRETITLILKK